MIKCIIFDCDGVLLDTIEANRHFYNAILDHLGYSCLSETDLKLVHAMTVLEAFKHVLSPADVLKAPQVAAQLDRRIYFDKVRVPANLHELLAKLKARYKLGIVTNRDARGIKMLGEFGLLDFFDVVVTSSDVAIPKPSPEGLLQACARLAVEPAEALYVGDSLSDMQAARAAAMPFAAYGNAELPIDLKAANMHELGLLIDNIDRCVTETSVS